MPKTNKVVLAYSGGLDTSVILHRLKETYGCEVVTVTVDVGQGEERASVQEGKKIGVKEIFILDPKTAVRHAMTTVPAHAVARI